MNQLVQESKIRKYESMYAQELEIVAESLQAKFRYEMTPNDILGFGQYAETWESYIPSFESDVTTRDNLGEVLNSNLGIIVASYSSLPIQYLGSVQPIADEAGVVYKRVAVATMTRAGVNAGDQLIGIHGGTNKLAGDYTAENITNATVSFTTGTLTYTINMGVEVSPGYCKIDIGGKAKALDDGEGHIIGTTIDGSASTVVYSTGVITMVFNADGVSAAALTTGDLITVNGRAVLVTAQGQDIPGFIYELQSQVVQAQYWLVKTGFSSISDMIVKKKFGNDLANEVVADAAQLINMSILYKAISKLRTTAIANETIVGRQILFSKLPTDAGVSVADHRRTFDDTLVEATNAMYDLAGRGDVNFIIAGVNGLKILKTLGLQITKRGTAGPHLIGFYDTTIPVFYAPNNVVRDRKSVV